MKNKIITLSFIFVLLIFTFCQSSKTKNTEIIKRNTIVVRDTFIKIEEIKKVAADISLSKLNVLYVGLENPVEIKTMGVEENTNVSISNGNIISKGNGKYLVKSVKEGSATISVYANGKKIGSKKFICKLVPDPTVIFNGLKSGEITKEELLNSNNEINATLDNFFFDIEFRLPV